MQDLFFAIIIGIVEGITEFLPVSSTAHIRIVQHYLGIPHDDPYWKMFAIVIQLGAVLCLPTYFWDRIVKFIRTFPKGQNGDRTILTHPLSLVLIACVCTAIPAFAFKHVISRNLENFKVIGGALVIGGAVMWAVDALCTMPRTLEMERINLFQAVWIGLVQTLAAIFPGTSRSMATIAAGQTASLSRAAALEFSFFLSIPTMALACGWDLLKSVRGTDELNGLAPLHMTVKNWLVLGVGFSVSYFVALGVVAWFMFWVRKRGFMPFAIYRIIIGIFVLLLLGRT